MAVSPHDATHINAELAHHVGGRNSPTMGEVQAPQSWLAKPRGGQVAVTKR
jgi:hypothetical protein